VFLELVVPRREFVEGILNDFHRYPLRIHSGESLYEVAWPVAQESGRAFHDSLYLTLAIGQGCSIVTADLCFLNALQDTPWGRFCLGIKDAQ
jgi:predicted nucleic acid-binding protein